MSNRTKLRRRDPHRDLARSYAKMCRDFDGREHPSRYESSNTLQRIIVADAVAGRDQGGNVGNPCFLWWDLEAQERIAKLRGTTVEQVFVGIAAEVRQMLGRSWP